MVKNKFYVIIAMLSLATLLMTSCSSEPDSTSTSDLEVSGAADARDTVITYLQKHEPENAPGAGIMWQEEDVTPPGWVGGVFKGFVSDEWTINVSYPVVALENTVYEVMVSSIKLGWRWKGKVDAYGKVTEVSAFRQMTGEESQEVAEEFLKNRPTFVFDGMDDTLRLVDAVSLSRCQYCWVFIFEFDSRHAGYGDRTGQMLAQVITPHRAVITVEQLEVASAIMDDRWDMLCQEMVAEQGEAAGVLSVAELLENPVYDTEVEIQGQVSLLGELFCPCFELTSGGKKVQVWYGLMAENDGAERPAVSVERIDSGDTVIVTGELKGEGGIHYSEGDFWARNIEIVE